MQFSHIVCLRIVLDLHVDTMDSCRWEEDSRMDDTSFQAELFNWSLFGCCCLFLWYSMASVVPECDWILLSVFLCNRFTCRSNYKEIEWLICCFLAFCMRFLFLLIDFFCLVVWDCFLRDLFLYSSVFPHPVIRGMILAYCRRNCYQSCLTFLPILTIGK